MEIGLFNNNQMKIGLFNNNNNLIIYKILALTVCNSIRNEVECRQPIDL